MSVKKLGRVMGALGAALVAAELLYLLVANGLIASGVIERAASAPVPHGAVKLTWESAYTLWPAHAHVEGLRLMVEDPVLEFGLTVESAEVDVHLLPLLRKEFRASHVRAQGVTYRMLLKSEQADAEGPRVAAYPPLEGFARPAVREVPFPPLPTGAALEAIWKVHLDDVEADVTELWFLEYHYLGLARVRGDFSLAPLRHLAVGPVRLELNGGELRVGDRVVSPALILQLGATILPTDLQQESSGLALLRALTASVDLEAALGDLGLVELYQPGVSLTGTGKVTASLRVAAGELVSGSRLELLLTDAEARSAGFTFKGTAQAILSSTFGDPGPSVRASLDGVATVPFPEPEGVTIAVSGLGGQANFEGTQLAQGAVLRDAAVVLGRLEVTDARPLTREIGKLVPLIAPMVLGQGPLVASATAYVTPGYTLVRLKHLRLGDAELTGAAIPGANGWSGAAAGHFGAIGLGLRLRESKLEGVVFAPPTWLAAELTLAGIHNDAPVAE